MPKFVDYYALLDVPSSASFAEIRAAYHKLALKFHPDHNPGDRAAEGRFKEINEAYSGLSSPQKRHAYDRLWGKLRHGQDLFFPSGAARPASFSEFFHSLFGDLPGGATGAPATPSSGADTGLEVHLSLAEALTGSRQVLSLCLRSVCPACAGSGRLSAAPCRQCGGAGRVVELDKVEVILPVGLRDGDRLSLDGLDLAARGRGGSSLKVFVLPHPDFKIAGDDLLTGLRIAAAAGPGDEVLVPALDGALKVKLPGGWRPGARLRVPGRGLRRKNGTRGDLLVELFMGADAGAAAGQTRRRAGLWS